jgi:hypothetical protein
VIIIATILFLAVLAANLWFDRGKVHNDVNHKREAVYKALALVPSTVLFVIASPGNPFLMSLVVLMMEFFVYLTLFDGLENVINLKKEWLYLGDGDGINDSTLDTVQHLLGKWWVLILKVTMSAVWLISYIVSFFHH